MRTISEHFILEKLSDGPMSPQHRAAREFRHGESYAEYKANIESTNKAWHKGQISTDGLDKIHKQLKKNLKGTLKKHDIKLRKEFSPGIKSRHLKIGAGVIAGAGLAALAYNKYKKRKEEQNENNK